MRRISINLLVLTLILTGISIAPGNATSTILGTTGSEPYSIAIDGLGNIYTTNLTSNNVSKITAAGVSSILGTTGSLPSAITIDSAGNIYTTNQSSASNNVSKITPAGVSSILGTTGSNPAGITIDSAGNIYTANYSSNNVSKITPAGVSSILGTTGTRPRGIAIDSAGNIYTANSDDDNVSKITPDGVSTILGTTGSSPWAIKIDSAGNLYTANFFSNNVSKITPAGASTIFGTTGTFPSGINIDNSGNIYTSNAASNNVTKITPAGVSSIFGTTGVGPRGVAIDSSGNIYTANNGSNSVTKLTAINTPDAPTIGSATAVSPTSASISFTAPANNGGATIERFTAISTPGSITSYVSQSGSGSIIVLGLTASTAYSFRVTATNSAGTSTASGASVSITLPASQAEITAAALAAQKAADAKREAEKQAALTDIWDCLGDSISPTIIQFNTAEIYGVTKKNYGDVIQDVNYKLFDESNTAIIQSQKLTISVVEQVVQKYVIMDAICNPGTFSQFTAIDLAASGLIPSKNKTIITNDLRKLPLSQRDSYEEIENAVENEILIIEGRKERLNAVLSWNYSENNLVAEPASTGTFPCGSGGSYTVVSGHVTGSDKCAGKLTFVSSVTAIDDYAFAMYQFTGPPSFDLVKQEPQITELVVPNTVKSIGASAFSDNAFLTSIVVSDSVKTIGRDAFRQSNNVTSLTIGSGAALIESDTYQEFRYLTKLVIPEGVTRIDPGAFSELYSVTSLSLPSTLVTLGEASIRGLHSLRTMNIPANLSIAYDPFHYFWYAPMSAPYLCSTTGASNTASVNAYFAKLIRYNTDAGRCTNSFDAPQIVGTYRQSPTTATLKFVAPKSFGAGTAHTSYEVISYPGGKRTSFPGNDFFTQKVTISSLTPGTSYGFEVVAINNETPFIASPPSGRRYVAAE